MRSRVNPLLINKQQKVGKQIKLIWDFRGPTATEIAKHHEKHLKEYISAEAMPLDVTGHKDLSNNHSIAYMVVEEVNMPAVRDVLLPHRGEIYNE